MSNIELNTKEELCEIKDKWGRKIKAKLISTTNSPYLEYEYKKIIRKYNPKYGDDRVCICGHTYYRHFDSWEDMADCGCKYCGCNNFVEATKKESE